MADKVIKFSGILLVLVTLAMLGLALLGMAGKGPLEGEYGIWIVFGYAVYTILWSASYLGHGLGKLQASRDRYRR